MSSAFAPILIFEDEAVRGLRPLSWTRPACELRTGALNLRERVELAVPGAERRAIVRPELRALLEQSLPELAGPLPTAQLSLALNARAHLTVDAVVALANHAPEFEIARGPVDSDGTPAAAWLGPERAARLHAGDLASAFAGLAEETSQAELDLFSHPWELMTANGHDLCEDFRALRSAPALARRIFGVRFREGSERGTVLEASCFGDAKSAILYPGVHVLEEANVLFGPDCRLKPGVVLDAEDGPIILGRGARLESNVTVQGPAYIGPGSVVHPMTRLREGSSIGALCKIGGELEESVVHDLSNKQHDGFIGHAVLGSWVNLGADTNASDLKNNYGVVRLDLGEGPVDTGERFVGPILGDHVKTGINTMLTTGAVIGVCSNVFGSGFPPRFVPSFSWGGAQGLVEYELQRAIQLAAIVHGRREVQWEAAHATLLEAVHRATASERG